MKIEAFKAKLANRTPVQPKKGQEGAGIAKAKPQAKPRGKAKHGINEAKQQAKRTESGIQARLNKQFNEVRGNFRNAGQKALSKLNSKPTEAEIEHNKKLEAAISEGNIAQLDALLGDLGPEWESEKVEMDKRARITEDKAEQEWQSEERLLGHLLAGSEVMKEKAQEIYERAATEVLAQEYMLNEQMDQRLEENRSPGSSSSSLSSFTPAELRADMELAGEAKRAALTEPVSDDEIDEVLSQHSQ